MSPQKKEPALATPALKTTEPLDQKKLTADVTSCRCGWPGPNRCPICEGTPMTWVHWGAL